MDRQAKIQRKTKETDILCLLNLDGSGKCDIKTGVGFFDHMLNSFTLHGGFDLQLSAGGDIYVDCHHTIEDVGIVLGKAFSEALSDKSDIARFGTQYIVMDEALAFVSLDIANRPFLVYDSPTLSPMVGDYDTQMTEEFLRALAFNAGITLHAKIMYGSNAHHCIEALFKALARALSQGVKQTEGKTILSSKGTF